MRTDRDGTQGTLARQAGTLTCLTVQETEPVGP